MDNGVVRGAPSTRRRPRGAPRDSRPSWFSVAGAAPFLTSDRRAPHIGVMLSAVREFIDAPDPARFQELALALFRFQYGGNAPYRRFCDRRGRTPANVTDWVDIPAV